jgi:hypothetical protein
MVTVWARVKQVKGRLGKRSLFCRKAPQKTFVTFTRERATSPGHQEQKSFLVLFFKKELLSILIIYAG